MRIILRKSKMVLEMMDVVMHLRKEGFLTLEQISKNLNKSKKEVERGAEEGVEKGYLQYDDSSKKYSVRIAGK
jgi:DNA-binding IclR family transcriptional regulator